MRNADFADAHLPCDHYGIFPGILGAADEEDNPGYCGVCSDLDRILCIAEWIWNIENMLYDADRNRKILSASFFLWVDK